MVTVRTGASPQDVLQGAKHVLFVEGTKDGLDVAMLEKLLSPKLPVEPPSASYDALKAWLTAEADQLLLLEAANRVLVKTRNSIKQGHAPLLTVGEVEGCTKEQVILKLLDSPMLRELAASMAIEVSEARVRTIFEDEVQHLSGGFLPLAWGTGRWRDLVSGKRLFRTMVNRWFEVPDQQKGGKARLTGRDAERAVAVDLLLHHQDTIRTIVPFSFMTTSLASSSRKPRIACLSDTRFI